MPRLLLTAILLATPAVAQTTWIVDAAAIGPGTGTVSDPFPSISAAIAASSTLSGDTVEVAAGIYLDSFDLSGKSLRVVGAPGPRPVIRGNGTDKYCTIASGEGPGTELSHLEFFAGTGGFGSDAGGAVQIVGATVLISDCVFQSGFVCGRGGAVDAQSSTIDLIDCEFTDNVSRTGGALYGHNVRLTVRGCRFAGNEAFVSQGPCSSGVGRGGAILLNPGTIDLRDCEFVGNRGASGGAVRVDGLPSGIFLRTSTFVDNQGGGNGGAVSIDGGVVEDCVFLGNRASEDGGGLSAELEFATVRRCHFEGNAARNGGAVHDCDVEDSVLIRNMAAVTGSGGGVGGGAQGGTLKRCLIAENFCATDAGGAVSALIQNCTLVNNVGEAANAAFRGAVVDSCIVWGNRSTVPGAAVTQVVSPSIISSLVEGDPATQAGPPLFFDLENFDVRLLPGSPAIDTGSPALPVDPDGSRADMGAYPFDAADRIDIGRYCVAKTTSAGCVPVASLLGLVTPLGPPARFQVAGLPASTPVLLLVSLEAASTGGFFGGTLCLGGSIVRGPVTFAQPASGCGDAVAFDVDTSLLGALGAQTGDMVFLQAWFRDVAQSDGTGVGLSDAIVATVQ